MCLEWRARYKCDRLRRFRREKPSRRQVHLPLASFCAVMHTYVTAVPRIHPIESKMSSGDAAVGKCLSLSKSTDNDCKVTFSHANPSRSFQKA
jgi:hypothetical protein